MHADWLALFGGNYLRKNEREKTIVNRLDSALLFLFFFLLLTLEAGLYSPLTLPSGLLCSSLL